MAEFPGAKLLGGHTDASYYSEKATSIDIKLYKGIESTNNIYLHYTLELQRWNGEKYVTVETQSGYFKTTVTKSFSLKGKTQNTYRFKCTYYMEDNPWKDYVAYTGGFAVYR